MQHFCHAESTDLDIDISLKFTGLSHKRKKTNCEWHQNFSEEGTFQKIFLKYQSLDAWIRGKRSQFVDGFQVETKVELTDVLRERNRLSESSTLKTVAWDEINCSKNSFASVFSIWWVSIFPHVFNLSAVR